MKTRILIINNKDNTTKMKIKVPVDIVFYGTYGIKRKLSAAKEVSIVQFLETNNFSLSESIKIMSKKQLVKFRDLLPGRGLRTEAAKFFIDEILGE